LIILYIIIIIIKDLGIMEEKDGQEGKDAKPIEIIPATGRLSLPSLGSGGAGAGWWLSYRLLYFHGAVSSLQALTLNSLDAYAHSSSVEA
jgi:hypothetical protein